MTLTAYRPRIYSDATSMLVFEGPADVAVEWSVFSGTGTVEPLSDSTDARGLACAIYHADGTPGPVVVRCTHGT